MALWDSSGGDYLTRPSPLPTESRRGNGGSISGPHEISKSTTQCIPPAAPAKAEAMPSIAETESLYGKTLAVQSAADWEQYQACRTPINLRWEFRMGSGRAAWQVEIDDCHARGGEYNYSSLSCKEKSVLEPWVNPAPVVAAPEDPLTKQIGGAHYKEAAIQPIEYIQANKLSFCEGNAVKYITRHRIKGGKADLEKAIHYLELEIRDSYGG
jgi:hypothetical protein